MNKTFPRLVRFASGKYGVEVRQHYYWGTIGETWTDGISVSRNCCMEEADARALLDTWPFPATPIED